MGVRSHEVETNAVGQGVGIPGMTARTQRLGGTILFRSSSRGTTVHVVLPNPAVAHSATLTFLPETVPIATFRA
jgi:signal transduction histidine kinase